jgi:hypothetical protein
MFSRSLFYAEQISKVDDLHKISGGGWLKRQINSLFCQKEGIIYDNESVEKLTKICYHYTIITIGALCTFISFYGT